MKRLYVHLLFIKLLLSRKPLDKMLLEGRINNLGYKVIFTGKHWKVRKYSAWDFDDPYDLLSQD